MKKITFFLLLVLPTIICTFSSPNKYFAYAEDEIDEDVDVEGEADDGAVVGDDVETEDETETTTSPHADTYLLFTRPLYTPGAQFELPSGNPVEFLVGFKNKGEDDFVIESVEASFRYPQDFNYYIQNFSAIPYNREVKSGGEATVSYSFLPSESFGGRPFGLNIALNYRDANGISYTEAVFNETVNITELDQGLDGEIIFLYIFFAGIVVLLLVLGQQFLVGSVGKRKRAQTVKKTIETGTANSNNVDYDWLPEETLRALQKSPKSKSSKSPKTSPKPTPKTSPKQYVQQGQSPKQRKTKRAAGSDD